MSDETNPEAYKTRGTPDAAPSPSRGQSSSPEAYATRGYGEKSALSEGARVKEAQRLLRDTSGENRLNRLRTLEEADAAAQMKELANNFDNPVVLGEGIQVSAASGGDPPRKNLTVTEELARLRDISKKFTITATGAQVQGSLETGFVIAADAGAHGIPGIYGGSVIII